MTRRPGQATAAPRASGGPLPMAPPVSVRWLKGGQPCNRQARRKRACVGHAWGRARRISLPHHRLVPAHPPPPPLRAPSVCSHLGGWEVGPAAGQALIHQDGPLGLQGRHHCAQRGGGEPAAGQGGAAGCWKQAPAVDARTDAGGIHLQQIMPVMRVRW